MLKYYNFDIVCQEIPNEITLAINITNCPIRCPNCHSKWLWDDVGEALTEQSLANIVDKYSRAVTCVCFMGGDSEPQEVEQLAKFISKKYPRIKTAWYSGKNEISDKVNVNTFQYIKIGAYIQNLGGLRSKTTNQRLYKIENGNKTAIIFSEKNG